ncbi:hypothetical protein [Hoeflea alexandrii]|uniref:hypothetical protein n=1 Tax=Hoeflea alexandrii TaxID=288436 RepID=UPI0022B01202|nr:hypothetical protein [Hoeflea alexandrii]MCZ4290473.1 hypothetical protein [Hoeflea alexandrii]
MLPDWEAWKAWFENNWHMVGGRAWSRCLSDKLCFAGTDTELLIEIGASVALSLLNGANEAGCPFVAMKAQQVLEGDDGSTALSDDFRLLGSWCCVHKFNFCCTQKRMCIKKNNDAHTRIGGAVKRARPVGRKFLDERDRRALKRPGKPSGS